MPVLDPRYIADWYYLVPRGGTEPRLLEKFIEKQEQGLQRKPLMQGDIGTHVMDVGGMKWNANLTSPVVIIEYSNLSDITTSIFDALIADFNVQRQPQFSVVPTYLLRSANISVNEQGVNCTLDYISDQKGIFTAVFGPTSFDFIGRVAKWYDTSFYTSELAEALGQTGGYQVKDGNIDIKFDIKENYFQGTGQTPTFSIQGYGLKGDITVVVEPTQFDLLEIQEQEFGDFRYDVTQTLLTVGTQTLDMGSARLHGSVERVMGQDAPIHAKISFESYVRYPDY